MNANIVIEDTPDDGVTHSRLQNDLIQRTLEAIDFTNITEEQKEELKKAVGF